MSSQAFGTLRAGVGHLLAGQTALVSRGAGTLLPRRLLASLPAKCTHADTHLDEVLVNPLGEGFLLHTVPLICERQARSPGAWMSPGGDHHTDPVTQTQSHRPSAPPDWQRPRAQAQPAPSRQGGEQEAKPGAHCSIPPLSPDRDGRVQGWQAHPEPEPRAHKSQPAPSPHTLPRHLSGEFSPGPSHVLPAG